jgi:hypothetical protein
MFQTVTGESGKQEKELRETGTFAAISHSRDTILRRHH